MSYHGTIVPASLLFSTQSEYIKGNMELYFLHCKLIHIFLWETTITTSTGLFFFSLQNFFAHRSHQLVIQNSL